MLISPVLVVLHRGFLFADPQSTRSNFHAAVFGNARSDSDYDFVLVVKETASSRSENMQKASEAIFDLDTSADVFVYSEKEFEEWKNELNSVAEAAHNLGVEIPLGTLMALLIYSWIPPPRAENKV